MRGSWTTPVDTAPRSFILSGHAAWVKVQRQWWMHDCGSMENGFPEQYNGYPTDDNRRYTLRAEVPHGTASAKPAG